MDVSRLSLTDRVRLASEERMRIVCMFAVDLTNGQLTPNNNTPLLAQALSVMNNYQAAAAGFGPPASPHAAGGRAGFPAASSPGPALDVYGSAADSVGYVQAASPQPSGFPAIAVSRAPLNYTPATAAMRLRRQPTAQTALHPSTSCSRRAVATQLPLYRRAVAAQFAQSTRSSRGRTPHRRRSSNPSGHRADRSARVSELDRRSVFSARESERLFVYAIVI
ncbi:RNA-binding protein Musashi-like Rbp6 [Papilio machaon]|uniref:RNA-binding protein Musashi-like Rbp6 n=1 Tax=Papilio machaon TaxID=76193 RepID=A0A194QR89_PAPMA|nr:RNA-binding protein Musashi-like Rbp6 [Papilio machaon]